MKKLTPDNPKVRDKLIAQLSLSVMSNRKTENNCLDEENLARLIDNRLTKAERLNFESHLATCTYCYQTWLTSSQVAYALQEKDNSCVAPHQTEDRLWHRLKEKPLQWLSGIATTAVTASLVLMLALPHLSYSPSGELDEIYQLYSRDGMKSGFKGSPVKISDNRSNGFTHFEKYYFDSGVKAGLEQIDYTAASHVILTSVLPACPINIDCKTSIDNLYQLGRWYAIVSVECSSRYSLEQRFVLRQREVFEYLQQQLQSDHEGLVSDVKSRLALDCGI